MSETTSSGSLKRPSAFIKRKPAVAIDGEEKNSDAVYPKKQSTSLSSTNSACNLVSVISKHYNELPAMDLHERSGSRIYNVRQYNNWVKSVMIRETCLMKNKSLDEKMNFSALDLGCGRGGDLKKWQRSGINYYVGIDVAEDSIFRANERLLKMNSPRHFSASLAVADCFYTPLFIYKSTEGIMACTTEMKDSATTPCLFDIVSSMFSFHYSFSSKESAFQALQNVSRHLKPGGMFIMVIPDVAVIRCLYAKAQESKTRQIGNSLFQIEFPLCENTDGKKTFDSQEYIFSLKEAVEKCPEFTVSLEELCPLASKVNLRLISECSFPNFYTSFGRRPYYERLSEFFGIVDRHSRECILTEEEWETVALYCSVGFVKTQ